MTTVTDPRFLDFPRWSALTAFSLLPVGYVGVSATEENWRAWAQQVKQLPALGSANIPNPDAFDDWRSWAFAYNLAVAAVTV